MTMPRLPDPSPRVEGKQQSFGGAEQGLHVSTLSATNLRATP
jgi:hypothetical protein